MVNRKKRTLKRITEKFEQGNLWCILNFDCKKGYEEARMKLENKKKVYEQAKLILEENIEEDKDKRNQDDRVSEQNTKEKRDVQARKELDEVLIRRKKKEEINIVKQESTKKKETVGSQDNKGLGLNEDKNKITVWDLPSWAKRTQVFEIVWFIGRVEHIEMIKSAYDKTRVEVEFKIGTYDEGKRNEIWCLLFMNQLLVRIIASTNNFELFHTRNRFSKRLLDLLENMNKILLQRQIKKSEAKALYIFKNLNNNNIRSAIVYFRKQEDIINISSFSMYYYDNKLRCMSTERQEFETVKNKSCKDYIEPKIY